MRRPEGIGPPAVHDASVALGRALRDAGVATDVSREVLFCSALGELEIERREQVYWAASCCFVTHPEQRRAFDRIFERFWDGRELAGPDRGAEHGESDPRATGPQRGGEATPQFRTQGGAVTLVGGGMRQGTRDLPTAGSEDSGRGDRAGVMAAYSPADVATRDSELAYAEDELAAMRRLAEELKEAMPRRRSRRESAGRRGRLDIRRTLRASLHTDGEPVRPAYAECSLRPRRLLILCDVSGSMDRYSRVLLASMKASVGPGRKAEAFVFATRLTRLTAELSRGEAERALERARERVEDWSGGTRIGEILGAFNRTWGRRGLARGAIVVIVSDGWDRGDPRQLAVELERLRLRARRLVWVNPRAASLDAQPLAVGMRAALPHVDDYVPGHDPRAIAGLASVIARLDSGRPARSRRSEV